MSIFPEFEIVVGTYEEYLLGYTLSSSDKVKIDFIQSFATHSHSSSLRCVANSDKYLASGGSDDRIFIYDVVTRKEHSSLIHHNSTVNCLTFTADGSHIISGSIDGVLSIVRTGSWMLEKKWEKPHKGNSILDIAVHPTGKLALTLGSDQTLRTWNLIKGRQAYTINLNTKSLDAKSLDSIKWSPCGNYFTLSGGLNLEYWNITKGGIENNWQFESKITSVCFLNLKIICTGHENGEIIILNLKTNKQTTHSAHKMRVKSIKHLENWLVSISSDGFIKIWLFNGKDIKEKGQFNTGCRCTCLTLVPPVELKKKDEADNVTDESDNMDETNNVDEEIAEKVDKTNTFKRSCRVIVEEEVSDEPEKKKNKKKK